MTRSRFAMWLPIFAGAWLAFCGGGSDGGGNSGDNSHMMGLCTKDTVDAPSDECGGTLHCLIEGCTGRCTKMCAADGDCPQDFKCGEWISPDVKRCYPTKECTQGGTECSEGSECVLWVDCGQDIGRYWRCMAEDFDAPDAS